MVITDSLLESRRFGLRIGRCEIEPTSDRVDTEQIREGLSHYDVVILRYPARLEKPFSELMSFINHRPLYADTLMYWKTRLPALAPSPSRSGDHGIRLADLEELSSLVLPVFKDYPSHYTANPLFNPADVLDGYVEWVTKLVDSGNAVCLVIETPSDSAAAFAVMTIDDFPDIKFGGIAERSRGTGLYRVLIEECMRYAQGLERSEIMISTQAHNLPVMSSWSTLGFKPFKAVTTVHLVRNELIGTPTHS
jgi:hypothetical protein